MAEWEHGPASTTVMGMEIQVHGNLAEIRFKLDGISANASELRELARALDEAADMIEGDQLGRRADPESSIGQLAEVDQPVDTWVRDVDEDYWLRRPDGWQLRGAGGYRNGSGTDTWSFIHDNYSPLKVVVDPR